MKTLLTIWRENTFWQNVSWLGSILLFLIMLPYYILTAVGDDE